MKAGKSENNIFLVKNQLTKPSIETLGLQLEKQSETTRKLGNIYKYLPVIIQISLAKHNCKKSQNAVVQEKIYEDTIKVRVETIQEMDKAIELKLNENNPLADKIGKSSKRFIVRTENVNRTESFEKRHGKRITQEVKKHKQFDF